MCIRDSCNAAVGRNPPKVRGMLGPVRVAARSHRVDRARLRVCEPARDIRSASAHEARRHATNQGGPAAPRGSAQAKRWR
eukprot:7292240-Alexandrium_andersonii.AAC.1